MAIGPTLIITITTIFTQFIEIKAIDKYSNTNFKSIYVDLIDKQNSKME